MDRSGLTSIRQDVGASSCIPDVHNVVLAYRGNALAIGRPGDDSHPFGMPTMGGYRACSGCIPYLHSLILTSRGDAFPVGRPCHHPYPTVVAPVSRNFALLANIPDLYLSPGTGGKISSMRRPCNCACPIGMAGIAENVVPGSSIPYLNAIICASAACRCK